MRTEVKKFGYFKASSVGNAISLLTQYGGNAKVIAGGSDLLNYVKNRIDALAPQYVVDITGLGLDTLTFSEQSGLTIGATTTVATLANDSDVNTSFAALAQAAGSVGSPEIMNQATVAGNISQEVWCWYLRNNYDCWRNGGTNCYAAQGGDNRYYHSLFGGNLCYGVHAGDIATALFALNADVTVQGPSGTSTLSMDQFMPGVSIVDGRVKENSLRYNEIITQIHVPTPASGSASSFYKVSDRGAIDFALANCAVNATFSGTTVSSAKVVLGGVANKPLRATAAESYLAGQQLTEAVIAEAATKALSGATPLTPGTGNALRVFIAQGAVKNALRGLPNSS